MTAINENIPTNLPSVSGTITINKKFSISSSDGSVVKHNLNSVNALKSFMEDGKDFLVHVNLKEDSPHTRQLLADLLATSTTLTHGAPAPVFSPLPEGSEANFSLYINTKASEPESPSSVMEVNSSEPEDIEHTEVTEDSVFEPDQEDHVSEPEAQMDSLTTSDFISTMDPVNPSLHVSEEDQAPELVQEEDQTSDSSVEWEEFPAKFQLGPNYFPTTAKEAYDHFVSIPANPTPERYRSELTNTFKDATPQGQLDSLFKDFIKYRGDPAFDKKLKSFLSYLEETKKPSYLLFRAFYDNKVSPTNPRAFRPGFKRPGDRVNVHYFKYWALLQYLNEGK